MKHDFTFTKLSSDPEAINLSFGETDRQLINEVCALIVQAEVFCLKSHIFIFPSIAPDIKVFSPHRDMVRTLVE
jgi:hypothetical protein